MRRIVRQNHKSRSARQRKQQFNFRFRVHLALRKHQREIEKFQESVVEAFVDMTSGAKTFSEAVQAIGDSIVKSILDQFVKGVIKDVMKPDNTFFTP